ncbi:hypothetical protein ACFU6S_32655 [Streptomyces sp. NPDC057456]|uniref:hypothetical protein n=1 Tax=Streptomyces sp. NPDC057456 TaxID=3346139 RepID=UPI0036ADF053
MAHAVTEEWAADGRRAVLRIAAATGAATKMPREAAAEVRERLAATPAEEPPAPAEKIETEHCMPIMGGKVHELMPGMDGSDGRPE